MKNIHVLPTDKPSRLGYLTKKGKEVFKDLRLFDRLIPNILDSENQNIYIISDEEIKEGDWYLYGDEILKSDKLGTFDVTMVDICKKIILTTDQDLIKDGVQAIPDEFLEWFVKNSSCEEVDVQKWFDGLDFLEYKIIIPKEERKIDTCYNFDKEIGCVQNHCRCEKEEPKQETLEEAVEKFFPVFNRSTAFGSKYPWTPQKEREAFRRGIKWQQERSYSEEEVKTIIDDIVEKHCTYFSQGIKNSIKLEWFEQFKKK